MHKIELTDAERAELLAGIEVVIEARIKDKSFFSEALSFGPDRDRIVGELSLQLRAAKSARRKLESLGENDG